MMVGRLSENGAFAGGREDDFAICLMHMKGRPKTMQDSEYVQVVDDVRLLCHES